MANRATQRAANRAALAALGAAWLAGCGGEPPPQAEETPAPSVIGDPLHRALERAESVQATVDAQAEALRRAVEDAEGN